MDLSLIKQKLAASQNKGQKKVYEKIDYSKIFWKPKPGKHQVRIIPSKFNKSDPFREVYFHYGFSKGPILALTNWKEKDPIDEFAKSLRKSTEKEDWQLASKISPKLRYFVPVVVRGEEAQGARLWEFGKLIYDQLLGIANDEDYGDFTDITEGRDFTVDAVSAITMGKPSVVCTLRVKPKTTPISDDAAFVTNVLENQPDVLTINKHYSFDELKELLDKWLNPEDEVEDTPAPPKTEDEEEEDDFLTEMNKPVESTYKLDASAAKSNASDKFDDLFSK